MKKIVSLILILIIAISMLFFNNNHTTIPYNNTEAMLTEGLKTYQNSIKDEKYTVILNNDDRSIQLSLQEEPIEQKNQQTEVATNLVDYHSPLTELIESYLAQNSLDYSQVAFSYYNTENSNQIDFNENQIMTLGSTYKLPLNMLISDKINQNIFQKNQIVSIRTLDNREDEEYHDFISQYGEATSIETLQKTSLVLSNNISSETLVMLLGGWTNTMNQIKKYGFSISTLDNVSSTSKFINGLKYLYDYSENYQEIIDYLLNANPNEYYKAYNNDVEIAHKYGLYGDAINDIAIVYSKNPYLIALFTRNLTYTQFCEISEIIHQWHLHNE